MHSTFSDGTWLPEELVSEGLRIKLDAIALTDHDTVAGVSHMLKAAEGTSLRVIPAIELDSDWSRGAMHFLGYGINPASDVLREHLDWLRGGVDARNNEILSKLNGMGIRLNWGDLDAVSEGREVGRIHFAMALKRRGYVKNRHDAFSQFLAEGRPAYSPKRKLSPLACIDLIVESGGVPVIAHPSTVKLKKKPFAAAIAELAEYGLGGLEVYYADAQPQLEHQMARVAQQCELVMTGGSDFHGAVTPDISIGRRGGGGEGVGESARPAARTHR
jgi:3',5'-nucleoside bisphosphate phosphatase